MRTPKYGNRLRTDADTKKRRPAFAYQLRVEGILVAEALLALYATATLVASLYHAKLTAPWAALFVSGCVFILAAQIRETLRKVG